MSSFRERATTRSKSMRKSASVTKVSEAGRFLEMEAANQDYFLDYPRYPDGCSLPFPPHAGKPADDREAAGQLG